MLLMPTPKGLVFTVDLSKLEGRENPRTVEAPIRRSPPRSVIETTLIDWGDGQSSVVNVGDTTFPKHTYAAEGVYTVTIRSATGQLPLIAFYLDAGPAAATKNISYAVTSVDHFAGNSGGNDTSGNSFFLRRCVNCEYTDTRFSGLAKWASHSSTYFLASRLEQPIESFCFDFATNVSVFYGLFYSTKITGSAAGLFDNASITTIADGFKYTFSWCTNLTEPFVFWKEDGSLDTDKFPGLASGEDCYTGCSAALRAQVPTAYGGTMTVS